MNLNPIRNISNRHITRTYNKRIAISKSSSWNWVALIRLMLMYDFGGSVVDVIDVSYKSNICFNEEKKNIKAGKYREKLNDGIYFCSESTNPIEITSKL